MPESLAAIVDIRHGSQQIARNVVTAELVDHMHLVQVPIVLGRGARIWEGLEALDKAYDAEALSSPSAVTHLTFTATATLLRSFRGRSAATPQDGR